MPKIGGESIRGINHRGGSSFGQPLAQVQSGLGIQMFLEQLLLPLFRTASLQQLQSQLGFAQRAADANQVSRPRPGTQHSLTAVDFSNDGQIDSSQSTSRGGAADKRQPKSTSRPGHSFEEAVMPFPGAGGRQSQAQQK